MWWLALVGCGQDGFLDVPDGIDGEWQLRAPSLAGCTVDYLVSSLGDGGAASFRYDLRGRLLHADGTSPSGVPVTASYVWDGDCVYAIESTERGRAYHTQFTCDRFGNATEKVVYGLYDDGEQIVSIVEFTETYDLQLDAYGQAVHVDTIGPNGLTLTEDLLWDTDRRLVQHASYDLALAMDLKRTFYWDHDRLLGFMDRGVGPDLTMTRYFEPHRLVEQVDAREESEYRRVTWEYEGDEPWPIRRSIDAVDAFYTQDVLVTCGPAD